MVPLIEGWTGSLRGSLDQKKRDTFTSVNSTMSNTTEQTYVSEQLLLVSILNEVTAGPTDSIRYGLRRGEKIFIGCRKATRRRKAMRVAGATARNKSQALEHFIVRPGRNNNLTKRDPKLPKSTSQKLARVLTLSKRKETVYRTFKWTRSSRFRNDLTRAYEPNSTASPERSGGTHEVRFVCRCWRDCRYLSV